MVELVKSSCQHHWIIDCYDVGTCQYCYEVRDFGKLLRKERRLQSKAELGGINKASRGRRGRPRKEEEY